LPRYETLQPEYNLYAREYYEENLEPIALKQNLGVMNYYSLASGFLTGKYRKEDDLSQSQRGKDVKRFMDERGNRILDTLAEIATEYKTTSAVRSEERRVG